MIVCLCGEMQSGKSTIAQYLVDNYGFKKLSFAGKMKSELSKHFKIPIEHFGIDEEKKRTRKFKITQQLLCNLSTAFDIPMMILKDDLKEVNSLRELLQIIGTNYIRATDEYAHIRATLKDLDNNCNYVVDDCRFANEVMMSDLSIWLNREGSYGSNHPSEQLNKNLVDMELDNNRNIEEVAKEIMLIIEENFN